MNENLFSVSSLNRYIKQMFDTNFTLRGLRLKGEISNFKRYSSGHIYFTIKDEESSIRAVMFREYTRFMPETIKDGDEIIAAGYVSVYPERGEYQFYAQAIDLSGKGQILFELEMLKKKLAAEGLFDESRKRKINLFPKSVGVISAPNSAAMSDIRTNLLRRNPLIDVKLFPSLVQGADAPKALLNALNEAKNANIDTLIIGRGGGASEDLSAFNDETLVRAAASFPVPIISAVGHEIDFTLIDFVADARASTPTGAAELATIDKREIYQKLDSYKDDLDNCLINYINYNKQKLEIIRQKPFFINPKSMYENKISELTLVKERLSLNIKHLIEMRKEEIVSFKGKLEALNPTKVLSRGYVIMENNDGKIVKSVKDVNVNQKIKTRLNDGVITSQVIAKGE